MIPLVINSPGELQEVQIAIARNGLFVCAPLPISKRIQVNKELLAMLHASDAWPKWKRTE